MTDPFEKLLARSVKRIKDEQVADMPSFEEVLQNRSQHSTSPHSTSPHSTSPHSISQHSTSPHSTSPHSISPRFPVIKIAGVACAVVLMVGLGWFIFSTMTDAEKPNRHTSPPNNKTNQEKELGLDFDAMLASVDRHFEKHIHFEKQHEFSWQMPTDSLLAINLQEFQDDLQ